MITPYDSPEGMAMTEKMSAGVRECQPSKESAPWVAKETRVYTGDGGFDIRGLPNAHIRAVMIVTAVNSHAPMLKSLEQSAKLFDVLAQTMDRWATESREGGWSTHQVADNRKRADDCRRYAAHIRAALTSSPETNRG